MLKYFELIVDKIYSLLFCLRCFPLSEALKIPVNISHNVKIGSLYKGCIVFEQAIEKNMMYIGHQGYSALAEQQGLFHIENGSKLIVKGKARLGQGIRLWIENDAVVTIGDNFYCNKNCLIRANKDVLIGRDVLMGWNIEMNTTDGHTIYLDGKKKDNSASIIIGDCVWIASHSILSKGSVIGDSSVVAQRSVVTKAFLENSILIGGTPARIVKRNITWEM